ncbi:MAG: TonB-dependent receptor [Bryobacteraceae bacterium]
MKQLYLAIFILVVNSFAQTGDVEVAVTDQTGAAVPRASVELWSQDRAARKTGVTGDDGALRFAAVPTGQYRVRVSLAGFNSSDQPLDLRAGQSAQIAVKLVAGSVSTAVQVSESAVALQTTQPTLSATLTTKELTTIPTSSRNYTHLIVAEAGVSAPLPDRTGRGMNLATSPGSQGDDATQSLNPSVNGARPTNNALMINGVDATNMMNGNGSLGNNINLPLDALDVVEMQTALYSARTGRNGGANLQIGTKIGTNGFHGSLFGFLQNEKFNANEFFRNRAAQGRPNFRRSENGGTIGGPVIIPGVYNGKDRTFFFGSLAYTYFLSGYANRATVYTGIPSGLGDVRTRETMAEVANRYIREGVADDPTFAQNILTRIRTFPAEQIPFLERKFFASTTPGSVAFRTLTAKDIHPVAINILNQKRNGSFLLPSVRPGSRVLPGKGIFGRELELVNSFPTQFESWSGVASVEHSFHTSNRLRLSYVKSKQFVEEAFPWANSSPSPTRGLTPGYVASLSDIHTFGPGWVNELRGGFFDLQNTRISKYRDITNSSLGIFNPLEGAVRGLASLMPTVDIDTQRSTSGIGNAWDFFDWQRQMSVSNTVIHATGSNTLSFGGEFRRPTVGGEYMARTNGDLDYDNWLFFLTGHGAPGGGSDLDQGDTRRMFIFKDLSFFAQDDWKVKPGLTLNFGARWDWYGTPRDTQGRIGNYYTPAMAAAMGAKPGFQVPGNSAFFQPGFDPLKLGFVVSPGTPWNLSQINEAVTDSTLREDYDNIAPRIGFAWQPRPSSKFVFRGGYGIFYERIGGAMKSDLQLSAPFFFYANVYGPEDMANPYPRLNMNPFQIPFAVTIGRNANGAPSWRKPDGSPFPNAEQFNPKNETFIDPLIKSPYTQQWSFDVQYKLSPAAIAEVRYVGTRGIGLLGRVNLTQPQDPRVTPVNGFTDIRDRAGALISPGFFVKPEFLGLNHAGGFRLLSNWGQSTYHGLQTSLKGRVNRYLTVNAGYAWSKAIDNVSSDRDIAEQDAFNLANNRGPANFDRRHRLTAYWIATMPTPWRNFKLSRVLLGGWQANGFLTLQSGAPFTITGASTANVLWAQPTRVRASWAPGRTLDNVYTPGRVQDRLDTYFDPRAFVNSPEAWGNSGRNILRGPAQRQVDLSLAREQRINERWRLEFRWEMYNLFNQTTFANPATTAVPASGLGTLGQITSTVGGPRTMQTGLRIRF